MMGRPEITVITPAYNVGQYLSDTIQSVQNQAFKKYEYLIIDDGSTDNTRSIAEKYAKLDSRIKVFAQKNSGAAETRNLGISHSRSPLISFIDGDDIWHPNFLLEQLKIIKKLSKDCLATFCWSEYINESGELISESKKASAGEYNLQSMLLGICPPGNGSSLLIKKSALLKAGPFNQSIVGEDAEMWYRILATFKNGFFYCIPKFLVKYRKLAGGLNLSSSNISRMEGKEFALTNYASLCGKDEAHIYSSFAKYALQRGQLSYAYRWLSTAQKKNPNLFKTPKD